MLTGSLPFSDNNINALSHNHQVKLPPSFPAELAIQTELETLVMRILSKELDNRPQMRMLYYAN
jgi:serine/threonine protein kinase